MAEANDAPTAPHRFEISDSQNALWRLINQCVSSRKAGKGTSPCVALQPDFGILEDRKCSHHFLLIPTHKVTGIEDPALLLKNAPNYFESALRDGPGIIQRKLNKTFPLDGIGFAINSADSRTQEQLHIHMDCIDPTVRADLKKHASEISTSWSHKPIHLNGADYRIRRVEGDRLPSDPFVLLANDLGISKQELMRHHSLAAVGAVFPDGKKGFYILDSKNGEGNGGHGEDLLDSSCGDCSQ